MSAEWRPMRDAPRDGRSIQALRAPSTVASRKYDVVKIAWRRSKSGGWRWINQTVAGAYHQDGHFVGWKEIAP